MPADPAPYPLWIEVAGREQRSGYVLEHVTFNSVTGEPLAGALALPDGSSKKPAVLLLGEHAAEHPAREAEKLDQLAREGNIVFAPELPPGRQGHEEQKSELLGPFYLPSLRVQLVGETLVGLRVNEILRCVNWLSVRPDVDGSKISGRASEAMGIALLHAAVLEPRIESVTLERTLLSYRAAINAPLPENLAQNVIPGVVQRYDLDDLMVALAPRPVTLIEPVDGEGHSVDPHDALAWVLATDRVLGIAGRVNLAASEPDIPPTR